MKGYLTVPPSFRDLNPQTRRWYTSVASKLSNLFAQWLRMLWGLHGLSLGLISLASFFVEKEYFTAAVGLKPSRIMQWRRRLYQQVPSPSPLPICTSSSKKNFVLTSSGGDMNLSPRHHFILSKSLQTTSFICNSPKRSWVAQCHSGYSLFDFHWDSKLLWAISNKQFFLIEIAHFLIILIETLRKIPCLSYPFSFSVFGISSLGPNKPTTGLTALQLHSWSAVLQRPSISSLLRLYPREPYR